ncbi:MAG: hypothetical protein WC553_02435 [Patescibacteria group bacterium]
MRMEKEQVGVMRWFARIVALLILVVGLMFYFGYGNPLPFINPDYSLWENVMLTAMPIMFIGLAVGWWREKIGGYLIIIPMVISLLLALATEASFSMNMLLVLIPGILYLVVGYGQPLGVGKSTDRS